MLTLLSALGSLLVLGSSCITLELELVAVLAHFCASAFSKAAFFCIDPLDEPTQYATTLDAIPASVPSNKVTISRWLAGTSSRMTSHSMTAKPISTMADTRTAP